MHRKEEEQAAEIKRVQDKLDQLREEVERVRKEKEEKKKKEEEELMQRMEENLKDSRKDTDTRRQRITTRIETLERKLVEDELARDLRAQQEVGSPLSTFGPSSLSMTKELAAAAEEEEDDNIPLAQRMIRKRKESHKVSSAPPPVSHVAKKTKHIVFGKYAWEVAAAVEQPQALRKKAPAKELRDQYEQKAEAARKAKQEEAEKRKLEDQLAAQ